MLSACVRNSSSGCASTAAARVGGRARDRPARDAEVGSRESGVGSQKTVGSRKSETVESTADYRLLGLSTTDYRLSYFATIAVQLSVLPASIAATTIRLAISLR